MIFLDLHKAYVALYSGICLEILEGYRVGPWARHILQEYWDRLRMVARAGGYCAADFKGLWGVTQVDSLSPTIFNLVVHAVVQH